MATLWQVVREAMDAERTTSDAWGKLWPHARRGSLAPSIRGAANARATQLFTLHSELYGLVQNVMRDGGVPEIIRNLVPPPRPWPRLPEPGDPNGWAGFIIPTWAQLETEARRRTGMGDGGAVSGPVLGAIVVTVIAVVAIAAYVAMDNYQVSLDLLGRWVAYREDTRRFSEQSRQQQARFDACVAGSGDPAQCAAEFPLIQPTSAGAQEGQAQHDRIEAEGLPWWSIALMAVGGVALVGGGLYVYARGSSAPTRIIRSVALPRSDTAAALSGRR